MPLCNTLQLWTEKKELGLWQTTAIPAVRRLRQLGCEFEACLSYRARPTFKKIQAWMRLDCRALACCMYLCMALGVIHHAMKKKK